VVIFDIPHCDRVKRNAFRWKLKELRFYSLQKSVWVCPFDCKDEINLLREFFSLNDKQIQVPLAKKIKKDWFLKKFFQLPK
jgi:DNA-binding transcriptional regulator PaaX